MFHILAWYQSGNLGIAASNFKPPLLLWGLMIFFNPHGDADFDPESGSYFDDPELDPELGSYFDELDPDFDDDLDPKFVYDSDPDLDFDSDSSPDSSLDPDPDSY
ncbi:hypothetical protein L3X38_026975 [Prunus dulcis]|uniref:Uncharacterized protein n=1 Tax=Prunus dulcis TaxID=3755 RepID=A0AAD4YZZ1_PRUDU|nr:hypothetical protein L3X38_026975 [Prunus dulcis]